MGTITTRFDRDQDLMIRVVTGEVSVAELIAALDQYYRKPGGDFARLMLWDFREATLNSIETSDLRQITEVSAQYSFLRPDGKTALVVSSELGFGLGRMYDIGHDIKNSNVSRRVFRSMPEALSWLGVSLAP